MATHVRLENTKTKGVWDCPEDAVDAWLALDVGWKKAGANAVPTDDVGVVASPDGGIGTTATTKRKG